MNNLLKTLALGLTLTAGLASCQSQTSEVETTGTPDGANMAPDINVPADTMMTAPADATATDSAAMPMGNEVR